MRIFRRAMTLEEYERRRRARIAGEQRDTTAGSPRRADRSTMRPTRATSSR